MKQGLHAVADGRRVEHRAAELNRRQDEPPDDENGQPRKRDDPAPVPGTHRFLISPALLSGDDGDARDLVGRELR